MTANGPAPGTGFGCIYPRYTNQKQKIGFRGWWAK